MNALVWTEAGTMQWQEIEEAALKRDEVWIEVEAVGICGSEIEGYLGHNSLRTPPLVMGHEFCGIVKRWGDDVTDLASGQRVVVNPLIYCGHCRACRQGLTQLCGTREIIGIHRPGAFAEGVSVPRAAVVSVSERISPYRAALAEPLACSLRATRRALEGRSNANVLVFGAGGIGLLCAITAKILGASHVVIADTNNKRLEMAKLAVVDEVVNPASVSRERIKAMFGDAGIDVVIDAAGFQPTREAAIHLLNAGGTFMNIGLGIDDTALPMNVMIRQEIVILSSFCYTNQDFIDAVKLLEEGKVSEEGWTEIRHLSEGGIAFQELVSGSVHTGKIILKVS